jgi:beta-lactamase regulating signal transducer with metallopeptidase domain
MPIASASFTLLSGLWAVSWQATVLVGVVLLMRAIFGRWIGPRWRHALWALVLVRLLIPVLPQSPMSLYAAKGWVKRMPSPAVQALKAPPTIAPAFVKGDPAFGTWQVVGDDRDATAPVAAISSSPTPVVTTPDRVSPRRTIWDFLFWTWLAVAAGLIARLVLINRRFDRSVNALAVAADPRLVMLADSARIEMGMRRTPAVVVTAAVDAPAVGGLVRPRILLPTDVGSIPDNRLRLILLHELAHIKCRDVAVDWVWAVVQSVHWFNPLLWPVWWVRRADREMARDDMVLSKVGIDQAGSYGRALVELARGVALPALCPGFIGLLGRTKHLHRRVQMISNFKTGRRATAWAGAGLMAVVACGLLTAPHRVESATPATAPVSAGTAAVDAAVDAATPADTALAAKMDKVIDTVDFEGTPLGKAIATIETATGANVFVDWAALDRAGVTRAMPVTLKLRQVKASKALSLIFKSVEGEDDNHKLGFILDQGVVTITTRFEMNKNVVTRKYDINDLLFVPPDYTNAPDMPPATASQGPTTQAQRGATELPNKEPQDYTWAERIDLIKHFITDNVDTNSWKDNGGDVGSISSSPLRAILLVTQTPENQEKVAAVLEMLRQGIMQISFETRVIEIDDDHLSKLPEKLRQQVTSGAAEQLNDEAVNSLLKSVNDEDRLTMPRLTLFNGQKATLSMRTDRAYVRAWSAAVADGKTTYEPVNDTVPAGGIKLTVHLGATPDGTAVMAEIDATLYRLLSMNSEPCKTTPESAGLKVQVPDSVTTSVHAAVKIPNHVTFAIGGWELKSLDGNKDAAAPTYHTVFLVKPVILKPKSAN